MNGSNTLFSPGLFADETFFSLGVLIIVNTYITLATTCTFLISGRITRHLTSDKSSARFKLGIYGAILTILMVAIGLYTHATMTSVLDNSSISMHLYRLGSKAVYSILVYISYTGLLVCLLLLMQMLRPVVYEFTGKHLNILARKPLAAFALFAAAYFSITSAAYGLKKEKDRAVVWANRLAVESALNSDVGSVFMLSSNIEELGAQTEAAHKASLISSCYE